MAKRKTKNDDYSQDLTLSTTEMKPGADMKIKDVECTPSCSEGPGPICEDKKANGDNGNGNGQNGKVAQNGNGDNGNIKLETIPPDPRWPNMNITKYCYTMYVDYHRCTRKRGDDYEPCKYFEKAYKGLCPSEWFEKWDSQMEAGTFPRKFDEKKN